MLKITCTGKTSELREKFEIVFVQNSQQYLILKVIKKITSARVYFMKTVKDCNDGQCRHTSLLCLYLEVFLFYREQPYAIKT